MRLFPGSFYGFAVLSLVPAAKAQRIETLLYSDDFDGSADQWMIEQSSGGQTGVTGGVLDIRDNNGTTVWFKDALSDSIAIEYSARILSEGASLTDMNCFWMARDPRSNPSLTTGTGFFDVDRGGVFSQYHDMQTYYAGFGANGNSTFRFRRYYPADGIPAQVLDLSRNGNRVILQDHDSDGLFRTGDVFLAAGQWYKIRLTYFKGRVEYFLDGEKAFEYEEQSYDVPYNSGFFGFRTTAGAHAQIDSVRIYRLTDTTVPTALSSAAVRPESGGIHRSFTVYNLRGRLANGEFKKEIHFKEGIR